MPFRIAQFTRWCLTSIYLHVSFAIRWCNSSTNTPTSYFWSTSFLHISARISDKTALHRFFCVSWRWSFTTMIPFGKKVKLKESVFKYSALKKYTEVLTHCLHLQKMFLISNSFTLTSSLVCCYRSLTQFLEVNIRYCIWIRKCSFWNAFCLMSSDYLGLETEQFGRCFTNLRVAPKIVCVYMSLLEVESSSIWINNFRIKE